MTTVYLNLILTSAVVAAIISGIFEILMRYLKKNSEGYEYLYGPIRFHLLMMRLITDNKKEIREEIARENSDPIERIKSKIEHTQPLIEKWRYHKNQIRILFEKYPGLIKNCDFTLVKEFMDGCIKREIMENGVNELTTKNRSEVLMNAIDQLQNRLLAKVGGWSDNCCMYKKILKWVVIVLVVGFVALVVWRMFVLGEKEKTAVQVEKIHNTKLALADVLGENLPPVPSNPDSSIPGLDENKNGIRDDVELAIFSAYPNSARTRAVLLQYALALQMEVTQELVNTGTVIAVAQVSGKAYQCVGEITSRADLKKYIETTKKFHSFVEGKQWNNQGRKTAHEKFYEGNLDSYSSLDETCDIELSTLSN